MLWNFNEWLLGIYQTAWAIICGFGTSPAGIIFLIGTTYILWGNIKFRLFLLLSFCIGVVPVIQSTLNYYYHRAAIVAIETTVQAKEWSQVKSDELTQTVQILGEKAQEKTKDIKEGVEKVKERAEELREEAVATLIEVAEKVGSKKKENKYWELIKKYLYNTFWFLFKWVILPIAAYFLYKWWMQSKWGLAGNRGHGGDENFAEQNASLEGEKEERDEGNLPPGLASPSPSLSPPSSPRRNRLGMGLPLPKIEYELVDQMELSNPSHLKLLARHIGVAEPLQIRFVWGCQQIERQIIEDGLNPQMLTDFIDSKGAILLPGESFIPIVLPIQNLQEAEARANEREHLAQEALANAQRSVEEREEREREREEVEAEEQRRREDEALRLAQERARQREEAQRRQEEIDFQHLMDERERLAQESLANAQRATEEREAREQAREEAEAEEQRRREDEVLHQAQERARQREEAQRHQEEIDFQHLLDERDRLAQEALANAQRATEEREARECARDQSIRRRVRRSHLSSRLRPDPEGSYRMPDRSRLAPGKPGRGGTRRGGNAGDPYLGKKPKRGRKGETPIDLSSGTVVAGKVLEVKAKEIVQKSFEESTKVTFARKAVEGAEMTIKSAKYEYIYDHAKTSYDEVLRWTARDKAIHQEALSQAKEKLASAMAEEVAEKEVAQIAYQQAVEKEAREAMVKSTALKAAGGFAIAVGSKYAFAVGGTGWRCMRGKNDAYNRIDEECKKKVKEVAEKDTLTRTKVRVKNFGKKTSVFASEAYKDLPPVKEVAVESAGAVAGGMAGSSIGAWVGGGIGTLVAPGAGSAVGASIGGFFGGFFGGIGGGWGAKKIVK